LVSVLKACRRLDLKRLVLILAFFGVLLTLGNALFAAYKVQKDLLVKDTLEANRVYASKLASVTDLFLESTLAQLKYASLVMSDNHSNQEALQTELDRLLNQTNSFNATIFVNKQGKILAVSPASLNLSDTYIEDEQALEPLKRQQTFISEPFFSPAGNLIISITSPVFDSRKRFVGFVGGAIYLQEKNILNQILDQHHHVGESYTYVVDQSGKIIFHKDLERIGEQISNNQIIDTVLSGISGSMLAANSQNYQMLAGFAPVELSKWGVVSQSHKSAIFEKVFKTISDVLLSTLPLIVLTLIVILLLATKIAEPLANLANALRDEGLDTKIDPNKIHTWYFEADYLKQALLLSHERIEQTIKKLDQDRQKDQLTQLLNRRGMENALKYFVSNSQPFSVLALDIDHFKRVNDNYGHDVGDIVIKQFAALMQKCAREQDLVCRSGGEEFLIFLPHVDLDVAYKIAERLRLSIENYVFEQVGKVTTSIGISRWPDYSEDIETVLKQADRALYSAKEAGRNRTHLVEHNNN